MSERPNRPTLSVQRNRYTIGIVCASFNSDITDKQLQYAKKCANQYGVACEVYTVAGSFELPQFLDTVARTKLYDGLVALGCLIKGETTHFKVISEAVSQAIIQLSLQHRMPIGFGVITALTKEQAVARTAIGYDAVHAVLQSLTQLPTLPEKYE
jgi:6,7-dimethyl-8-ribityllumazine synthase